jgi:hypothetical protein
VGLAGAQEAAGEGRACHRGALLPDGRLPLHLVPAASRARRVGHWHVRDLHGAEMNLQAAGMFALARGG